MNDVFEFHKGSSPLLLSIPHDGRGIPADIAARMTRAGRELPDTDWHVARLYDFAQDLGASVICARYSRYVVDLNRPPDDGALYAGQVATGICPSRTFGGAAIYDDGNDITSAEKQARVDRYWRPYHEQVATVLEAIKARHGYALLWDAHSIASEVPGLFDGELPVLNLGTNKGKSCAPEIEIALSGKAAASHYAAVCNGRFTGGYITRHYGQPRADVHAVQLELAQRSYMNETTLRYDSARSSALRQSLRDLLETFMQTAKELHA